MAREIFTKPEVEFMSEIAGEKIREELIRQIQDSIKEEKAAIDVYRRRADYARRGYPELAKFYDHLREEEEHHIKELQDITKKMQDEWAKELVRPPTYRQIRGKSYKLVGVEPDKDKAEIWAANMRKHGEKITITPFEGKYAVYRQEGK